MSTPRKAAGNNENTEVSEIRTPFRERALEEQRLKDEVLIRNTPGYRKLLSASTKSHDILNKDPNEVRSFLQDLSQVLARKSQGNDTTTNKTQARNLIDELAYEESQPEENELLRSRSEKLTDNNIGNETQPDYTSLSQTVFAKLQERDKGLKSRKIDPIIIQDVPTTGHEDELTVHSPDKADSISMEVLRTSPSIGMDQVDEPPVRDPVPISITQQEEPLSEVLPSDDKEETEEAENEDYSFENTSDENLDDIGNDPIRLNVPAVRRSSIKPLQIMDLKHLTRQFLNENRIILPKQTWSTIQEESLNIMDFLKQKIGTLQKQELVDSFIDMGVINNVDDMFELAHELLPLELQSRIESYLF